MRAGVSVRVGDGLGRGRQREAGIDAAMAVALRMRQKSTQIEILDLRREGGRKLASVKVPNSIDAAAAMNLAIVKRGNRVPHGSHDSHARHHDSPAVRVHDLSRNRLAPFSQHDGCALA